MTSLMNMCVMTNRVDVYVRVPMTKMTDEV